MTKKQSTDTALATDVAELKAQVAALIAALTEPEATEKPTKTTRKAKQTGRKSNGNKWYERAKNSKVWKEMKNQGSTAKNKAVFAEKRAKGVALRLVKVDGSEVLWNAAS